MNTCFQVPQPSIMLMCVYHLTHWLTIQIRSLSFESYQETTRTRQSSCFIVKVNLNCWLACVKFSMHTAFCGIPWACGSFVCYSGMRLCSLLCLQLLNVVCIMNNEPELKILLKFLLSIYAYKHLESVG